MKMTTTRRITRLAVLSLAMFSIPLISGCGETRKQFKEAYDKAFVESWKRSFASACAENDSKKLAFCQCVSDKAIANLSVEQLQDIEIVKKQIVPQCKR